MDRDHLSLQIIAYLSIKFKFVEDLHKDAQAAYARAQKVVHWVRMWSDPLQCQNAPFKRKILITVIVLQKFLSCWRCLKLTITTEGLWRLVPRRVFDKPLSTWGFGAPSWELSPPIVIIFIECLLKFQTKVHCYWYHPSEIVAWVLDLGSPLLGGADRPIYSPLAHSKVISPPTVCRVGTCGVFGTWLIGPIT